MALVTFEPDGAVLEVRAGTPLLAAILAARRPIGYACRGLGVCVSCRLQVWGAASAVDAAEAALLARLSPDAQVADQRIACLVRVEGDVRVRASYW
ncbi:MAG: 2Fe-2S iron-sulfur cluster-binding protein [Bradymonadia bacterium]|jgi:ferredoxin